MKTSPIPRQYDQLISYSQDIIEGLKKHGSQLGLQQNTAASLAGILAAAKTAEQAFQGSRAIPGDTLTPAQSEADAAAKKYFQTAKKILGEKLGDQWSAAWAEAGFVNGSLAVPAKIGERESLLLTISQYLVKHPGSENADLNVTAARGLQLHEALRAARNARKDYTLEHKSKKETRDAAVASLKKHLSWTISDLKRVMPGDDLRWHSFGLAARNASPADAVETPAVPAFPAQPVLLPDPVEIEIGDEETNEEIAA